MKLPVELTREEWVALFAAAGMKQKDVDNPAVRNQVLQTILTSPYAQACRRKSREYPEIAHAFHYAAQMRENKARHVA